MIFYHNTAPQLSYVSKPSSKSIGGLIDEVWSPLLHHLGRILGSKKMGFCPWRPNEWFPKLPNTTVVVTISKDLIYQLWFNSDTVNHLGATDIGQKSPKMAPFSHHLLSQPLKTWIFGVKQLLRHIHGIYWQGFFSFNTIIVKTVKYFNRRLF